MPNFSQTSFDPPLSSYRTHIGAGWRMKINLRGYPVWWHRWLEAWWIVTGKWSLHRAWQAGKDRGHLDEMMRTAVLKPIEEKRNDHHENA